MRSVMTKDFSRVAATDMQRSTFDRGHGLKTAFDSGYLVPVELQEVYPGDEVDFDARFMARLAPVVTPVLDNVFLDLHAFFVPSRLVWNNFTKMMGERKNPKDSIDYLTPMVNISRAAETYLESLSDEYKGCLSTGSLADFFGIPVHQLSETSGSLHASALPFRAYAKIWDDWFRDENLQDSIIQTTDELGDQFDYDSAKFLLLRKRGKRHDYFTSALPWPMRGDGVNFPLGGFAPVIGNGQSLGLTDGLHEFALSSDRTNGEGNRNLFKGVVGGNVGDPSADTVTMTDYVNVGVSRNSDNSGLVADLSETGAATIASMRLAFQLQRLLEADARAGCRYVEILRQHFKCICPDGRLQRSEFLGSSTIPVTFSPVAQTSATVEGGTAQGNLAASAHAYGGLKFRSAFTEHGYIIVLASVRCDLNYQQGLDRLWSRRGRYDYYWPTLAHLSEQEVKNKEIFAQGCDVVDAQGNIEDDQVFGYQERYAELRYNPSKITGKLRSGVPGSLDVWHLAQYFEDLPKLSEEFIEEDPPLRRVLAVTEGEPEIILDAWLGQKWTRPLPVYSVPGLVDHL